MRPRVPSKLFSREELLLPPNLVSALRLPLALLFPFVAKSKTKALLVLGAAALTDAVDGWLARTNGQVTATGAVLDPIADKTFALSVVATLVARRAIPAWGVPALLARELFEAPLLVWIFLQERDDTREAREAEVRANEPGKIATTAQLVAVMAALATPRLVRPALVVAGVAGTIAGLAYWKRELERVRGEAACKKTTST